MEETTRYLVDSGKRSNLRIVRIPEEEGQEETLVIMKELLGRKDKNHKLP